MNAATTAEWLDAAAIGAGAFVPGALLILALDHDLNPGHVPAVRATADRARLVLAVGVLLAAIHVDPTTVGSR
jgi:hypothetical protein